MTDPSNRPRTPSRRQAAATTFMRKYIRADLLPDDRFFNPGWFTAAPSRPSEFLNGGTASRWAEIGWRIFLTLVATTMSVILTTMMVTAVVEQRPLFAVLGIALVLVPCLGLILASQAFLRWMFTHLTRQRE